MRGVSLEHSFALIAGPRPRRTDTGIASLCCEDPVLATNRSKAKEAQYVVGKWLWQKSSTSSKQRDCHAGPELEEAKRIRDISDLLERTPLDAAPGRRRMKRWTRRNQNWLVERSRETTGEKCR